MNTLLLTLFCFISSISSIDLTGVSDGQIRSCLLRALKRFHEKSPPLEVAPPLLVQTSTPPNVFERILPPEIKFDIMDRFLDFDALVAFRQINRDNSRIPDEFLFRHLAKFNPYYLVEDPIVNKLLFAVISKHFVKSKNLQSPHIYDELQLLILKLNFGVLDFEAIPKRIYFYLIAFINETVHGLNAGVPLHRYCALEDFATLLRQHDMTESLQFFKNIKESFELTRPFKPNVVSDLEFLHSKPTKEEIRVYFAFDALNINIVDWFRSPQFTQFITCSVIELFADEIPNEQLMLFSPRILTKKPCLDKWMLLPEIHEYILGFIDNYSLEFTDCVAFCAAYQKTFGIELPQCYLYSRSVLKELSFDEFQHEVDYQNIISYKISHFNLYTVEMIIAILRSGRVAKENVDEVLNDSPFNISSCFERVGDLISL
jgi:hypothetical protein